MKIKTSTVLIDLNGEKLPPQYNVGRTIGQIITAVKTNDPLRNYSLGKRFYEQKEVDVTESDIAFIKDAVKYYATLDGFDGKYTSLVTGQLIQILEKVK